MRRLIAKHAGRCARTGRPIKPGDPILWTRGRTELADGAPYVSDVYRLPSGAELYQNRSGRCEDAPCCGCCNF